MVTATSNSTNAASTAAASNSTSGLTAQSAQETSDRFLKLLVAQMQNQDPLSPMDNAQVTSQMAQINTVSGISQLNTTVSGLTSQFAQLQALQSASLVGHSVLVEGNKLNFAEGAADGAFELAGSASAVRVDVMSASGKVIDSMEMGAQAAGKHGFTWAPSTTPASTTGLTFKVVATSPSGAVTSTALVEDQVMAVSTNGGKVELELKNNGTQAYSKVKTIS